MVLSADIDLLNPPAELEKKKHKLKRLVQSPNSFFMDVKCKVCSTITTVFSHSQTVVRCAKCSSLLCQPTGGRALLTEGLSFRKKMCKIDRSKNRAAVCATNIAGSCNDIATVLGMEVRCSWEWIVSESFRKHV
ncbi:hypothetical protein R1flu_011419 [Riccia fluitans]|uniref:40S ribosomal protein S27 n=1 Tax=Riccia fluitans TaxID=41844 RepID=A0ABD1ZBZ9_9MARC